MGARFQYFHIGPSFPIAPDNYPAVTYYVIQKSFSKNSGLVFWFPAVKSSRTAVFSEALKL